MYLKCLRNACSRLSESVFAELKHITGCSLCHLLPTSYLKRTFYAAYFGAPLLQHRNTGSCVVDTGVSLSTHVSSYKCNLLGQFISCQARKWEGGHPGGDNDVTGRHESQDCSRGENTAFEQADISLEWYMWMNAQAVTTTALIALWNVLFVLEILHARLIFGLCMAKQYTGLNRHHKEHEWHAGHYTAHLLLSVTHHINWTVWE